MLLNQLVLFYICKDSIHIHKNIQLFQIQRFSIKPISCLIWRLKSFRKKIGNRNFLNEDRLIFRKREFSIIYRFVILVMELPFQFQSFVSTFSAGLNTDTIDVFISFALALKLYRQLSSKKLSSRHFL